MKRFGILICIFSLLVFGGKCKAQSQFSPALTKMETSLFGIDYSNQSDDIRLKRIEEVVYGNISSSSISQRVDKLTKDLSADVIDQKMKPKRDSFEEDDNHLKENIPKADSNINYPIVNELEKTVFNKEFKTNEINQRISNLEQKVFKKTYNDDLNSRVERLKMAVLPDRVAADNTNTDEDDITSCIPNNSNIQVPVPRNDSSDSLDDDFGSQNYATPTPRYNSQNSVLDNYQGNSDIAIPLAALEKRVLKKTFPDDTLSNRLTRLELNVFHSTFTDDDEQTRLDRIASAYQAKKTSSKYDNNKFSQHAATAMQVGAILLLILAAVL